VGPSPVRVKHDLAVTDVGTSAAFGTTLEGKFWMCFGLVCTDELTQANGTTKGEN